MNPIGELHLVHSPCQYHNGCRTAFMNRVRPAGTQMKNDKATQAHGLVLASLVSHIVQEKKLNPDINPVFKMAELARSYTTEMLNYGVQVSGHSTRLREEILQECELLEVSGSAGQEMLITFKKDVDRLLRENCRRNFDREGFHLAKTADIVRRDLFEKIAEQGEQAVDKVPQSLSTLVKMIMNGSGLGEPEDDDFDQAVESICQLLVFHSRKRARGKTRRHCRLYETPVPKYTAMKLYATTRKKGLIDTNFKLGLGWSYDRLQKYLMEKALRSCQIYRAEGVVCPITMHKHVFTVVCADNVDQDTSTTFASDSFHGTSMSIMQHPTPECLGVPRDHSEIGMAPKLELPPDFANVRPLFLDVKAAKAPPCNFDVPEDVDACEMNEVWLEDCRDDVTAMPFAAHVAERNRTEGKLKTRIAFLPVFREHAQSVSTMAHCMGVTKKTTEFLNPGQTPVLVVDQPLYALCKQLQWLLMNSYGEDKFIMLLGGMHIEQVALKIAGQWLDGSGWTAALVEAGVTTKGRAEGAIKVCFLTRSRYFHQVSAASLHRLMRKAYEQYAGDDPLSFAEWKAERRESSVMFQYWEYAFKLEMICSELQRTTRTSHFPHYVAALNSLAPWCFSLDHVNYARWLPVEISRLQSLQATHPDVHAEFMKGHFTARKTTRSASAISLDQTHEHVNKLLKTDGGIVGLQGDPVALLKHNIVCPEIAAEIEEFEQTFEVPEEDDEGHHLETPAARKRFVRDVSNLTAVLEDLGNPFSEEGEELFNLESKKVFSAEVSRTVRKIQAIGASQYEEYVEQRIKSSQVPLHQRIPQNRLALCSTAPKRQGGALEKAKTQIQTLKADNKLLGRLFVGASSTNRESDLDTFLSHENQEFPPALSLNGELRSTSKAVLYRHLADLAGETPASQPRVDVKILEGAALIHMLKPGLCRNFSEYTQTVFLPFIQRECNDVCRLDVVWDRYFPDTLKMKTREKRGPGQRTKVTSSTKIPQKWDDFLRNADNKTELFRLLGESIPNLEVGGTVVVSTVDDGVVVSPPRSDVQLLSPCNHEESDTRVFVHVADASRQGNKKILVRTTDTDVVVIALSCKVKLPEIEELWVQMKAGQTCKFIPIHEIATTLGPQKSLALPSFHAFTGCDNVSSFYGIGKNTALKALEKYPDVIQGFIEMAAGNAEEAKPVLLNFVQIMYGTHDLFPSILDCRKHMFCEEHKALDSIPPSEDALIMHMKRASYMAQVFDQSMIPIQELPSPADCGWKKIGTGWEINWRTISVAAKSCRSLTGCKCRGECRGNCGCARKPIPCGKSCKCKCLNK